MTVEIRTAGEEDLHSCLALDDSYTTTHTWQVEAVRGEPGAAPFQLNSNVTLGDYPLSVTFRPVKLPRERKVVGPLAAALTSSESKVLSAENPEHSARSEATARQHSALAR